MLVSECPFLRSAIRLAETTPGPHQQRIQRPLRQGRPWRNAAFPMAPDLLRLRAGKRRHDQHERTQSRPACEIPQDHAQQPDEECEQAERDGDGECARDDRGKHMQHNPSAGQRSVRVARDDGSRLGQRSGMTPEGRCGTPVAMMLGGRASLIGQAHQRSPHE
jgi:hypothetical protein